MNHVEARCCQAMNVAAAIGVAAAPAALMTEDRRLAWRQLQLYYKVRAGRSTKTLQKVREQLHLMHALLETPKTEKEQHVRQRWLKRRGTKHPAGARWNLAREREIKAMSAEEFTNNEDQHPNRKVSKTRVKAALLLNSLDTRTKMNEGCARESTKMKRGC